MRSPVATLGPSIRYCAAVSRCDDGATWSRVRNVGRGASMTGRRRVDRWAGVQHCSSAVRKAVPSICSSAQVQTEICRKEKARQSKVPSSGAAQRSGSVRLRSATAGPGEVRRDRSKHAAGGSVISEAIVTDAAPRYSLNTA